MVGSLGSSKASHPSFHLHSRDWGGFSLLSIQLIVAVGVFSLLGNSWVGWGGWCGEAGGLAGFRVAAPLLPGVLRGDSGVVNFWLCCCREGGTVGAGYCTVWGQQEGSGHGNLLPHLEKLDFLLKLICPKFAW